MPTATKTARTRNYTWDYNNRPTAIGMSGATTTFKYDQGWQRVKKTKGATSTIYALGIYEVEGSKRRKYIPGETDVYGIIEGQTSGTSTTFIHNDHLSGASVLTNASGTKTELIDYYAFGEARFDEKTGFDSPRKYTGKELDEEINLYYYGARYYNPKTGRFISIDPTFLLIGMKGFEQNYQKPLEQLLTNPQELNSYSYVTNNPYRYIDPNGEFLIAAAAYALANPCKIKFMQLDDLEVYKLARELSSIAWDSYNKLDWRDKKTMGDQFLSATDSIAANLAEGFGRHHYLDRNKFSYNARGSLLEARHWAETLLVRKKITHEDFQLFSEKARQLSVKLNNYIRSTKKLSQ
jgi:four helix bundle protein